MKGVPCFVEKNCYGYWVISEFNNLDQLVTMKYLYYTKREAIKLFKQHLKQINTNQSNRLEVTK